MNRNLCPYPPVPALVIGNRWKPTLNASNTTTKSRKEFKISMIGALYLKTDRRFPASWRCVVFTWIWPSPVKNYMTTICERDTKTGVRLRSEQLRLEVGISHAVRCSIKVSTTILCRAEWNQLSLTGFKWQIPLTYLIQTWTAWQARTQIIRKATPNHSSPL